MTSSEHSATVDTVVTSIVAKMSVAKSLYFKHFESKSIHFQSDILESLLLFYHILLLGASTKQNDLFKRSSYNSQLGLS